MRILNNNKGIALITALMLTLISLVMIMGILTFLTQNIKLNAAQKSYRNATEAVYGGVELVTQDIIPRLFSGVLASVLTSEYNSNMLSHLDIAFSSSACLQQKLTSAVGSWSSCSTDLVDPKIQPDIKFNLLGAAGQSFTVYTKITDTIPGVQYPPTPQGGGLIGGGVAESSTSTTLNLQHYVYTIEVAGEKTINPSEKSRVSVLYEY